MKFTKQDAIESLKRELTNNDRKTLRMSAKTLDKLTDTLISEFADDEIGLPDFCTKALGILSVVNDNVGKDKSDFVKQWEAEHKPDEHDPEPEPQKQSESPEMKALLERIAALEKDKEESSKRASIEQKRKDIIAKLKEKGVKSDEWLDKLLSKVNLTAETDVDAEVEDTLLLYNLNKANGGTTATSVNPQGDAPNNNRLDDVTALAKQRREMQG